MDIEKIKKINEMSKQLRNHHFSMSSNEAILDAQKIYDEDLNLEMAPVKSFDSSQSQTQAQLTNVPLLEKKFQLLLDQNFKSFRADLTNLQETVDFLQQELSKMHQRVSKLQQPVKTVVIEKPQAQQTSEDQFQEVVEEAPKPAPVQKKVEEVKQSHPRSGDLTSKDVSIEKFFYFGNGR